MKKILSLLLSAVIILSGFTFAYADDPEEVDAPSSGASAYTEVEQSFIDQAYDDSDRDLRTLSVEVVKAANSTYSLDDIYTLLLGIVTTYTGRQSWAVFDQTISDKITNDFSHYDSATGITYDTGAMLWTIRNILNNIQTQLVPAASSSLPSIYELIDDINTAISDYLYDIKFALVDANNTPYLVTIYNKLVDIASGNIDYTSALFYNSVGVAEYASRINSAIVASYNGLYTKLGILDNIDSKLSTTNSTLNIKLTSLNTHAQTIEGKIDTQTSNLSSDLSSSGAIASNISSLQSDINNITWNQLTMSSYGFYDSSLSVIPYDNSNLSKGTYYYKVNLDTNYQLYKIIIPLSRTTSQQTINQDIDIKGFYYLSSNRLVSYSNVKYYFALTNDPTSTSLYILDFPFGGTRDVYIEFDSNITFRINDYNICYGMNVCSDYYVIADFIKQYNELDILHDFKDLYASDDFIAAKENQQQYEDQVIEDFTGSGSAAAKASDAASAKDISSAVSSGLNSGGSVNNSLNVFNPSGGFWGWFSQENSDYINNLSSQNRLRSSGSGSDWVIDDPYQRNAEELQSILGGDR